MIENKIQILGLREFFHKGKQKMLKKHAFHSKMWRADSVIDLFADVAKHLEKVPVEEQYNLYYTASNCVEGQKARIFASQAIIPFDIDGIDVTSEEKYIEVICEALVIDPKETGIVFSGNGLQLIIGIVNPFEDPDTFDNLRPYYVELCKKIDRALQGHNLPGTADTVVWSEARLLRMPNTKNIKKDKGEKWARLVQGTITPRHYDLRVASGLPVIENKDHIMPAELKRMPKPDHPDVIIEGCNFLRHCRDNPNDLSEPEWYAMLSIAARLEDGRNLCHSLSSGHKEYSKAETDEKIDQSIRNAGPRTCSNIESMFDGCLSCKHRGCVSSPILIKGPEYIGTAGTNFHEVVLDKYLNPKPGKPNYEDLRKYFETQNKYVSTEANWIYTWNKSHWKMMPDSLIEAFGQQAFDRLSSQAKISEFLGYVRRTNKVETDFFSPKHGMMNFKNGVLDLSTKEFQPHSPQYGFRSTLPYDYEPEALCPTFDKFMEDITCNREDIAKLLLEFMGYCFSNMPYRWHKCLILTGEGSNGKSTFLEVMKALAGKEAYSALFLNELQNDTKRFLMVGKLFNVAEETPKRGFADSSIFKVLTSGGAYDVKQLYKQPEMVPENRTKIIMACNELPSNVDPTQGFFRRLLIVPFEAVFRESNIDYDIGKKLHSELPGILNRVIAGYDRLVDQGRFTRCTEVDELIEEYKTSSDSVTEWLLDNTKMMKEDETFTGSKELFDDYCNWCDRMRIRYPKGHISFSRRVGATLGQKPIIRKIQGKQAKGFLGIILLRPEF